jgi:ABC-type transport system involved in multi-copper enzyme maturation permease subunit
MHKHPQVGANNLSGATSADRRDAATVARRTAFTDSARRIGSIALNTFRETVRDRVLYNLILFAAILVIASVFVSELSIYEESKFIADLGLSAMTVFGAAISIFIGVALVFKEIERRTVYFLLSKPVRRHEFIIGKYLGLCLTLLINSAAMMLGTMLALIYANRGLTPLLRAVPPAAFLIYLELALLVSVALLFSSFTTPMLSALFSIAAFVIGNLSPDLRLAGSMSHSAALRWVLTALYYLLPNLSNFGFINEASHGVLVPWHMLASAIVYTFIYVTILLSATVIVFNSRSFK